MITRKGLSVTQHREWIKTIKPQLAYNYHIKGHSIFQISKNFRVGQSTVRAACDLYGKEDIKNIFSDNLCVLLVDPKDMEDAFKILKEMGVYCRLASKKHELTEIYESEI